MALTITFLRTCRAKKLIISQNLRSLARWNSTNTDEELIVRPDEMKGFAVRCLMAVGAKEEHARAVGGVLVGADYRGHYSHGVNRLDMYCNDIKQGVTLTNQEPSILKDSDCTAYVDGMNLLGPVVGNFCMQLAISKATNAGVGWVAAKGSNHYGMAGWYSVQAADAGLLGLSFTNTSPLAITSRGKRAFLGTNPLTLAAPSAHPGDHFILDMATTTAAVGKIEMCHRKGIEMPRGWGADGNGKETTIPAESLDEGALLPLGGSELTGGYKGSGLAMMVEIFCGILAGANFGPSIRKWKSSQTFANLGQCFIAVNPDYFASGFNDRMADIMSLYRNQEPALGETEVLVAGDPERRRMSKCETEGGIRYHRNVVNHLNDLANSLCVERIKVGVQ